MTDWRRLRVAPSRTHHLDEAGAPAYEARFDDVLKYHAPGLAPVQLGEHAWHIRADGSPAYDTRYTRTFGFYEGLAAVQREEGWFHIDPAGEPAYAQRYAWCGNFQQGRCTVRDVEGRYHHITPSGAAVYEARWRYAGDYRDGVAVVQAASGRSTHITRDGALLHDAWFVDLDVFHKGFARARDEDGWMHVDEEGRPVYTRRFYAVEPFYNGQARVERFDGALEVIDEAGEALVELRPARRSEFASLSGDLVGFWKTQAIGAAVALGIFEALPAREREVAERCGLRADGARRILRALCELGLTRWRGDSWTLTSRGEYLKEEHPLTLADAAIEYAGAFTKMWSRLPEALANDTAWEAPDIFEQVARDERRREGHHRMLRSYARHDYAVVCGALGLRGDEHVIDAGGGVGVLAEMILEAHPGARVTVLERPEVVELADLSNERLSWRGVDLFEPWELEGDVVVMSRVLHDWDDANALELLLGARAALPTGGRLYIVEMLVPEERVAGALCDLHLLMATGGRERSAEHFGRLLEEAGFELTEARQLPALPSILVGVAK